LSSHFSSKSFKVKHCVTSHAWTLHHRFTFAYDLKPTQKILRRKQAWKYELSGLVWFSYSCE